MPPRHQTLPPPQTSAAREAQKSFYCSLCSKGYSRMNEYETHLSSYDHAHKQRLKDMKAMVRDPNAGARARKAEAKADGLVCIKLVDGSTASTEGLKKATGFKRSGFKSAFSAKDVKSAQPRKLPFEKETNVQTAPKQFTSTKPPSTLEDADSDTDDDLTIYNPHFPTN